jgi:hypothetical protein
MRLTQRICAPAALLVAIKIVGTRFIKNFGESDANRLQVCWLHLDRESRRRRLSPFDQRLSRAHSHFSTLKKAGVNEMRRMLLASCYCR